ncbi:MAG: indolepyruvate ferredoxin oxidoreductase subunit alpha [Clostridia bacterium]|nr:indolepyruvate ferredoxin oxidoreductase subunit alpha [Clostridia bacterium]
MSKQLMIGNEAVARGLYEGGIGLVSSYPGTPSTEITEFLAKYENVYSEWAPNEKVALEVAFGASLRGVRSACAMKHVGLNVAADPLFTMSYTGVNAGLVICVADDPGMFSSQNEQDSRHYALASKVPMVEPSDASEALSMAREAFEISERFDTPVLFRICMRTAHSRSPVTTGERVVPTKEYVKNGAKYIMMPGNAKKRHPVVEKRTEEIAAWAETCSLNRWEKGDGELGIITSGTSYQYVKEVFGEKASILKLGLVYPMPARLIREFASSVRRLVIVEELDPFIETFVRSLGIEAEGKSLFPMIGEFTQDTVRQAFGLGLLEHRRLEEAIPVRPPVMCPGCPHRGLYYVLAKLKATVIGDIGCYTLGAQPPLTAVDTVLCMGASVSGIHGFNKAGGPESEKKTVAVIGDSTFMHSGMTGLADIAYNGTNSTVVILDNSITGMTGHQQNPTTGLNIKGEPAGKIDLESLCRALGIRRVRTVDPYDLKACETALKVEMEAEEPSVIISRRPCMLLKNVKPNPPLSVRQDLCRSCKSCMRIGCPAISLKNGKAVIDHTQCVGCGVCAQLCAFHAIGGKG